MLFGRKRRSRNELIEKIKKEELDFSSMFSAINNRAELDELFKSLCKRCHPDAYVDNPEKMAIAEELFKSVRANSTNIEELKRIEETVLKELEI